MMISHRNFGSRVGRCSLLAVVLACASLAFGHTAAAQAGGPGGQRPPAPTPKAGALLDLSGYWVSIIDDEWRWRMMTPAKGDLAFLPLNPEGRRVAGTWDLAKDEADGNQCKAFGAAGIMHLPERLHITWADDRTLDLDTDAGMQKRLPLRRLEVERRRARVAGRFGRNMGKTDAGAGIRIPDATAPVTERRKPQSGDHAHAAWISAQERGAL